MSKILYFPTRYYPSISGAEFYIQRIAEILTKKYGQQVDIYTSNALDFKALRHPEGKTLKNANKLWDNVNGMKIHRYPIAYQMNISEKMKYLNQIPEFISLNLSEKCVRLFLENGPFTPKLIENFINSNRCKYDLIHSTFFPYFNIIISLIIGKIFNLPTICTPFFHFSNPRYLEPALIDVLKKFNLLIACTRLEKEFLITHCKVPENNIEVIPMGVDIGYFQNQKKLPQKNDFKKKYFQPKEKNYKMVLYCGYKNYEKGALSLLKAIPYILKKVRKVYFVCIGPSTLAYNRELAKQQKNQNMRIINLTPDNLNGYYDKKKIAAFKETDVFLMPSRSDAFGIAFLEAWAAKKAVIGANTGAMPEVIRNNIDGLLAEFDDPIDIAEKVIRLLKNKRLRNKMGNAGYSKVAQNNSWETITHQTYLVYRNILSY